MKIAAILLNIKLTSQELEKMMQPMEGLNFHSKKNNWESLKIFSFNETLEKYSEVFDELEIYQYNENVLLEYDDIVFVGGGRRVWEPIRQKLEQKDTKIYHIQFNAGLQRLNHSLDNQNKKHIFSKLGPKNYISAFNFYYFPWSYLFLDSSWGEIDQFGHRIDFDFRALAKRDSNHKVIGCFGGSAAWGWGCLDQDLWTNHLQEQLNGYFEQYTFTVLNFASPSHVVLNEIFHYILFCDKIKFDVVISHSGANDIFNSQGSDQYLLEEWDITYQQNFEQWSQILHNTHDLDTGFDHRDSSTMLSKNQPLQILKSYVNRLRQFKNMAESRGEKFIWGLQPMGFDKEKFHWREVEYFAENWNKGLDAEIQNRFAKLYHTLIEYIPNDLQENFLNFHTSFNRANEDEWLYWDIVHLAPDGNKKISQLYFEQLKEIF